MTCQINSYLTAGDTVRVAEYQHCPSIIGRIMAVSYSSADMNGEAVHPQLDGLSLEREETLFKLQLFIANDNYLLSSQEWNYVPSDVARACRRILEAVPTNTNASVWISVNSAIGIVFLLHSDQCTSHEYGSVVEKIPNQIKTR